MTKAFIQIDKFKGMNINGSNDPGCAIYMKNFTITDKYELKKRPGFFKTATFDTPVKAMWFGKIASYEKFIFVVAGNVYEASRMDGNHTLIGTIEDGPTNIFTFNGKVYFQNSFEYYSYDGVTFKMVDGYIPIIATASPPSGGGMPFEAINRLTVKRRQQFSATGTDTVFNLAEKQLSEIVYVKTNGNEVASYTADTENGIIRFSSPPSAGINNVEICYSKPHNLRRTITFCCYSSVFGGNTNSRVFMWGNFRYPTFRFHSELANGISDAEYFPETNFTSIGGDCITDIVSQYNKQIIFTKSSAYYSYCDLRTDSTGKVYSSFPVYNLNSNKGNLIHGSGCSVQDKPITLCNDGINAWESTSIENEKNAVCISFPVSNFVNDVSSLNCWEECRLYNHQSKCELYFVWIHGIYIYNYKLGVWYMYTGIEPKIFCDVNGALYFCDGKGGVFTYKEGLRDFEAVWESNTINCNSPFKLKDILSGTVKAQSIKNGSAEITFKNKSNSSKDTVRYSLISGQTASDDIHIHRFRIGLRRVPQFSFTISSKIGASLHLQSIGIITSEKGELHFGL